MVKFSLSWLFSGSPPPPVDYFSDWIAPRVPYLLRAQPDPERQVMTSFPRSQLQAVAAGPERMLKASCLASVGVRVIDDCETDWSPIYAVIALEDDFKKIVSDLMALNSHAAAISRGITQCDEAMEHHLMLPRQFWVEQQLHMPWFDIQKFEDSLLHSKYELSTVEVRKCLMDGEVEIDEWSSVLLAEGESIEMLVSSFIRRFRTNFVKRISRRVTKATAAAVDDLKFNADVLFYIFGADKPMDQEEVERWVGSAHGHYCWRTIERCVDFRSKLSPYCLPSKAPPRHDV